MSKPQRYRVVHGLDYRDKRAEPGEVVDDLPEKSLPWLLKQGHVIPYRKGQKLPDESVAPVETEEAED